MTVLVTGATGFIGRHVVRQLARRHEVVAVVRDAKEGPPEGSGSTIVMDLAGPLKTKALPREIDVIIHLAQGTVPFPEAARELFAVNTGAAQQLLDYGREAGARQFILASTGDVYGERLEPCRETDPVTPANYYAVTKHAAELLVRSYAEYLRPCIVRLFQPYGPGQSHRLIPNLAQRVRTGQAVSLHRGSRPRMSPIYVDDVLRVIERAMACSHAGTINVAGDQVVGVRELAEAIGRVVGREPTFEETGRDASDRVGDNRLMKALLEGEGIVALMDGLARTLGRGEGNR